MLPSTVATPLSSLLQLILSLPVSSWLEPSDIQARTVNGLLRPVDTVSMPGLTSRLVTLAPLTVRDALLLTDTPLTTAVALMSVVPTPVPVAVLPLRMATRGSLTQLALLLIGKLVPSDISAVAS
ncbi:hypothetical protein D3C85_1361800 [compost metagenome]